MFEDDVDFGWSEFQQGAGFLGVDLSGAFFARADLTDVTFTEADLRTADFGGALLNRAMLFGADLRGAKLEGAVIGGIRIDEETRLLGHHADPALDSSHTVAAIRSRPCCAYDPAYGPHPEEVTSIDAAKSVYQMLEELGRTTARPRLQSRSCVRRQDRQRTEYPRDALTGARLENRAIAGLRWARAKTTRMTLLYGESPWRVVGGSLATIVLFALCYPLVGGLVTSAGEWLTYNQLVQQPDQFGQVLYYSASTLTPPILSDLNRSASGASSRRFRPDSVPSSSHSSCLCSAVGQPANRTDRRQLSGEAGLGTTFAPRRWRNASNRHNGVLNR